MKFIEFNDVIFETTNLSISKFEIKSQLGPSDEFGIGVSNSNDWRNKIYSSKEERDNEYEKLRTFLEVNRKPMSIKQYADIMADGMLKVLQSTNKVT